MTLLSDNKTILCEIAHSPIQKNQVLEFASSESHGAQNFFFGAVREHNAGRNVVAVGYDAAVPLAEVVLKEIALEVQEKWGSSLRVCIVHRVGKLTVGECSVAIGVSSPHRNEAFQGCRYVIEQIKLRAPIWKKEYYQDGETEWLKGHALCSHSH